MNKKETEQSRTTRLLHGQLEIGGEYIVSNNNWLEIQTKRSHPNPVPLENVGLLDKKMFKERVRESKIGE